MTQRRKPKMSGYPDPSITVNLAALDSVNLTGRGWIVVGGTDGLGRAIARLAAARGASVTIVGRTFRDEGVDRISFMKADLSSMREARRVGRTLALDGVDTIVLTTGIMAPPTREETAEELEIDIAVSYLSRVAVLEELVPRWSPPRRGRVFVMGFPGAGNLGDPDDLNALGPYSPFPVHMNTVAGNEAIVLDAVSRYPELGFFGLHPGLIRTNIRARYMGEGSFKHRVSEWLLSWFTPTTDTYAAGILPLLVAPELEARSGLMFGQKANAILASDGMDAARVAAFREAAIRWIAKGVGAS